MYTTLPVDPFLPEIVLAVQNNSITLLQAEPGAGKTTRVPAALLAAGLHDIYVLEPRRLAARMAARRVAQELGERVGESVGYQVRFEDVSSASTRLWFVTEGVLTRKLLGGGGGAGRARVVILDEFHERHLESDLALALLRKLQQTRADLRLLIMSATLPGKTLSSALGAPEAITAPGKVHPVALRYTPASAEPLEQQVASAVEIALAETSGHVLTFLPGAVEIRRALQACEGIARRTSARLLPLYGDLPPDQQDAAVAPSSQRKIICATNVAESSITIEGVTAVVDSGLARVLTYSLWSGLSRLQVSRISKSSAVQRAGRAGRTGAGLAIRLYSEADLERRPEHIPPEILRADLTQTSLLLSANGIRWSDLPWIDEPPEGMQRQAEELLVRLEALSASGAITPFGRKMAKLPVHPRLARFVLDAAEAGHTSEACKIAALLSEGRLRPDDSVRGAFASDIDALLASELSYSASRLARQLASGISGKAASDDSAGLEKALLCAFPDRVARKKGETLFLSNGPSAKLDRTSHAHGHFLVAIEIDDRSDRSAPLVRIASAMSPDWLLEFFPDRITTSEEMVWNRESERVEQINALLYDRLAIDESRSDPRDRTAASVLLTAKVLEAGIERFVDPDELSRLMNRIRFAANAAGIRIPDDLMTTAVGELVDGIWSFSDFRAAANRGGLVRVLQANLPMRQIDEVAPEFIRLSSGRRARIEYHHDRPPSVASRLQDFFGMRETPTVARGSVPLVIHLLAPNHRPVQVTTDLVSFWKNLYPQVRRELSRRYPKHTWPELPA